jgi:rRNA maturation endonuclease Nob1
MKECTKCGDIWPIDSIIFCPHCGQKLTPAKVIKCQCGMEYHISINYKYCIICGKPLVKPEVKS